VKGDRDPRDYINDILAEIARISEFTKGMTFDAFSMDTKTVYAVIRSFEVIGEAVKNLTDDVREKHPEIPWKRMAGMRDKLIHEYFGVSTKILWETIRNRIPELKEKLESLREE
jgi:uncharacterized protein with HEPN domain